MTVPEDQEPLLPGRTTTPVYDSLANNAPSVSNHAPPGQIQTNALAIKVYKRRWYVMFVFGMTAMTQCVIWNTFSPIAEVCERVFGWDNSDISMLVNWGPISYVIATFFFSWLLDEKGLRPACLLSAFLVAVGTGLRCITSHTAIATPLIHVCQFLNGLAGPIAMGAAPALSAEWFPPEQRTTATAIGSLANVFGLAVSFLIGPFLVPVRKLHPAATANTTTATPGLFQEDFDTTLYVQLAYSNNSGNNTQEYDVAAERGEIMRFMYYSCGWSVFCLLLFFTYFPSKPPLPPSPTASMERLDFKLGLKKLAKNTTFRMICFTYGLALGVFGGWQGILDVNLKDHHISENEAGWMGFYGVVAACASTLVISRFADVFSKHIKWFLVLLFLLSAVCFLLFSFTLIGIVPDTIAIIYCTYIFGNIFISATIPLFFEMACEVTYPVAEGVTNLILTLVNNIFGLVFLLMQTILHKHTMWENWCVLGSVLVCVPMLLLLKESYNRLEVDESAREVQREVIVEKERD